jgi:hypothetical protein
MSTLSGTLPKTCGSQLARRSVQLVWQADLEENDQELYAFGFGRILDGWSVTDT